MRINPLPWVGLGTSSPGPGGGPVVKPHQASSFLFDLGYHKGASEP